MRNIGWESKLIIICKTFIQISAEDSILRRQCGGICWTWPEHSAETRDEVTLEGGIPITLCGGHR